MIPGADLKLTLFRSADFHLNRSTIWRVLDGVFQQVIEHLLDSRPVNRVQQPLGCLQADLVTSSPSLSCLDHVTSKLRNIDALRRDGELIGLDPGDIQ